MPEPARVMGDACEVLRQRQVANAEYFMTTELDPSVRFDTTAANTPDVLAFLDQCVRACTKRYPRRKHALPRACALPRNAIDGRRAHTCAHACACDVRARADASAFACS